MITLAFALLAVVVLRELPPSPTRPRARNYFDPTGGYPPMTRERHR